MEREKSANFVPPSFSRSSKLIFTLILSFLLHVLLNHALSLLLWGIELPKYLVSVQEHSGFSCSLALPAVTHWIFGSGISPDRIWPLALWPWIKKPCFWACVPQHGPSTLVLSRPSIFYVYACWELSVKYRF